MVKSIIFCFLFTIGVALNVIATDKYLDYPNDLSTITAEEVAKQVYFVNHFYSFDNYGIGKKGRDITVVVLRNKNSKQPTTITLERYMNNITEGFVNSRDLFIFRSGKLKGVSALITTFINKEKPQSYEMFIPSVRKLRRFNNYSHGESWAGTDFTFGDISLRRLKDETHELLGQTVFDNCLNVMKLPATQRNKYTKGININIDCSVVNKKVHMLKSTTKNKNWWYDYRISFVDSSTFADYRVDYFKNDKKVRTIDKSWISADYNDKRAHYWHYWYGKSHITGHETLAYVPKNVIKINYKYKQKDLWLVKTLKKIPSQIN